MGIQPLYQLDLFCIIMGSGASQARNMQGIAFRIGVILTTNRACKNVLKA